MPLLGLAIGAATGALAGSLADVGIDDGFIKRGPRPGHARNVGAVRHDLRRGRRQGPRRVRGHEAELIFTNLSNEQEAALRAAFAD